MRPLHRSAFRLCLVLAAGLLAAGLPGTLVPAGAQTAPTRTVVASGLANPRGVEVGPDGSVYVAESGAGGQTLVHGMAEGEPATLCAGNSGAVTRVRNGVQLRLAALPSFAPAPAPAGQPSCTAPGAGAASVGPSDVAVRRDGSLAVTMGLGGNLQARAALPADVRALFGTLQLVIRHNLVRQVADITAFEAAANPDGGAIDSNPYGVTGAAGRGWLATDAGGNDLVRISPGGHVNPVAVFPDRPPTPFMPPSCFASLPASVRAGFPPPGTPVPAEAVPTSVVLGPDGAYYVSILSGFPFAPGNAAVFRVDRGTGAVTPFATGLTQVVGIAFGPDGSLFVAEISTASLLETDVCHNPVPGAVLRFHNGARTTVADDLAAPGGVAVGADGAVYVSTNSTSPTAGQVLKIG